MTAEDISLLTRVLIAYQGALLDNVTPNLRAATVRVDYPVITSRVFYRSLDGAEREIAELIETYVIADFSAPMNSDFTIIELQDEPLPELRPGEKWVFLIREPSADETR